eukprot:CAMPEP_0118813638 /NCGR_PEP_ID=MMETSP1162-20130426/3067_1 /TAXON_ID=33656 /ORGANISM="Phaeocystis Sp, Strain CCMP2710" /LENGTH=133 /DNA_ID=CAMNT_0006743455 /DNA_START=40 /DNA_END=442 /DNA_ORIENTATION=+
MSMSQSSGTLVDFHFSILSRYGRIQLAQLATLELAELEPPFRRERLITVPVHGVAHEARGAHVVGGRVQDGPLAIVTGVHGHAGGQRAVAEVTHDQCLTRGELRVYQPTELLRPELRQLVGIELQAPAAPVEP